MRPFPKNLGEILKNFETVLIPEINNGQLIKIIRDVYFVDAKGYNKIMGIPITKTELVEEAGRNTLVKIVNITLISNPFTLLTSRLDFLFLVTSTFYIRNK